MFGSPPPHKKAVLGLMLTDEYRYKVLKLLADNPCLSQRELARELGISLGKVNYCLKALIDIGMIKVNNFKNSHNKQAYVYLLTPKGIEDKAKVTVRFLNRKLEEHQVLQQEIEALRQEVIEEEHTTQGEKLLQ
ncbi:MarR family EPS-associated transcriptional regulator [Microbulbifer rhizosphaerae]|uniref:EPS-associated MarR family transcriptional regulator n=1 Tax=Microbulbifer rhizosphaerae TaxID=1562603 RepID=A0A7W4WFB9_9GAMM|nr:MarR family EPS-associated transcriptional regulator [Microbulbifer rhizosphaerae]MBB3063195.1 EPS-associated MarR family transcriptional regulator [Microbulbifer rhizosphaerae]